MQSHRNELGDRRCHVFVVESEASLLGQTCRRLFAEGCDVTTARDLPRLSDRILRVRPDIVLIDVLTPDLEQRELSEVAAICGGRGDPTLIIHSQVNRPLLRRVLGPRATFGLIPRTNDDAEFSQRFRSVCTRMLTALPAPELARPPVSPATSGTYAVGPSASNATIAHRR
jgi:CheY-like chemotaxis protein